MSSKGDTWAQAKRLEKKIKDFWNRMGCTPPTTHVQVGKATLTDGKNSTGDGGLWVRSNMKNGLPPGATRTTIKTVKVELRRRGMQ